MPDAPAPTPAAPAPGAGAPPPAVDPAKVAPGVSDPPKAPESVLADPPVEPKPGEEPKEPPKDPPKPDDKKPDASAPIDLKTLKIPEGLKADDPAIQSLVDALQNNELSPQARADKLLELHAAALKAAVEGPYQQWRDTQAEWRKEVAGDKDIGTGDEKNPLKTEISARIAKVIDAYGGDDLRQALVFTGAGNNPAIVKAFAKIAEKLTEGGHVAGKGPAAAPKSAAERMYPHLANQGT